ncbi:hypothetical protein MTO96_048550 [Rhipicephalus appendiculatus]
MWLLPRRRGLIVKVLLVVPVTWLVITLLLTYTDRVQTPQNRVAFEPGALQQQQQQQQQPQQKQQQDQPHRPRPQGDESAKGGPGPPARETRC